MFLHILRLKCFYWCRKEDKNRLNNFDACFLTNQFYVSIHSQAAVSAQVTSSTEPVRSAVAQAVNSGHAPANEPAAVPNVAVQDNRPVNPNVQMNAQGGPVVNEEDFNRDWLDWMYTFSRAAILLSIVYFYSSFSRFVMVMGAMLLVYL